ncbi:RNA polymerase sigma factor [candidate division KSB1 bacterium]|nr:RNA polymerase sigma factor [candidate division KSB1 bacterium]
MVLCCQIYKRKNRITKTDQQLIDQFRQGNTDSFKEIVKRYEQRVAATVISMLGYCPEADDVGQETFIRFYKALHDFRGDSSIATYLTRIAINLSLNEIKRRRRRKLFFPQSTDSVKNIIDETEPEDVDLKKIVNIAIQQLEPAFRAVLVLRLVDGYSTKETADILKIPEGTVLSRLARAQKKIKDILTPVMGEKIYE